MGWDATNPYEDSIVSNFSLQLPDSTGDSVAGTTDHSNTMEPFLLPAPSFPEEMRTTYSLSGAPLQGPLPSNSVPSSLSQQPIQHVPFINPYVSQMARESVFRW